MRKARLLSISLLVSAAACGGRYHTEVVGQGTAIVQPRTVVAADTGTAHPPWAVGGGIQLPRGSYDLAMWFDLPRAQVIDWTVTCPGVQLTGSAGEAFAQYRERRLAQLRAQRQRDQQQVASMTSSLVGAVAPRVQGAGYIAATGEIETPSGTVAIEGEAQMPAAAIGAAVAANVGEDHAELLPGDDGRGRIAHTVHVETTADGVCAVTAAADDATVLGTYQVLRTRDLEAEARLRVMASNSMAMTVRGKLQARLVAHGADPELRARQLALQAEARARVELDLRMRAEAEVQAELQVEARLRTVALEARAELRGRCVRHGADPDRRARLDAAIDAQRATRRAEVDAHARLVIDLEQRRLDIAQRARFQLRARLVAYGAIPRPPMPALLAEEPGEQPFPGARWTPGKWVWMNGRWEWRAGYWSDPDVFQETGGDVMVEVGTDITIPLGIGVGAQETLRDHRNGRNDRVRDHRDGQSFGPSSTVRDHRDSKPPEPTVRDHRSGHDEKPTSTIRDHRDDKKDKDDDSSNVRDHRRR